MIEAFAPAKINLTLHVTGQRADGYHLLDSLVVFVDAGDVVRVKTAKTLTLSVTGPRSAGVPVDGSNLVLRAARLMAPGRGAHIHLEKTLPAAAGIGGGSSDAAATLRALNRLWHVPIPKAVAQLGADVPVCLRATTTRMQGIGEQLSDVPGLPDAWLVLVNPGVGVQTPDVFKRLRCKNNTPMGPIPRVDTPQALADWLACMRNDLQAPAIAVQPVIEDVLNALRGQPDCLLARMSGSGATCWGLFARASAARAAAESIAGAHPKWWSVAARIS